MRREDWDKKDWNVDEDGWWFYEGTNYKPTEEEIKKQEEQEKELEWMRKKQQHDEEIRNYRAIANQNNIRKHPTWKEMEKFVKQYIEYFAEFEVLFDEGPVDGKYIRIQDYPYKQKRKMRGCRQQYEYRRQYFNLDSQIRNYGNSSNGKSYTDFVRDKNNPIRVVALGSKALKEGKFLLAVDFMYNVKDLYTNYDHADVMITKKKYGIGDRNLYSMENSSKIQKKKYSWSVL